MTKQLILTFAVFCTLQARANVQPVQEDTVRHYSRYEATELLQPLQPLYLDGVVVPAIGLSVSPEVRQLFSARHLAVKIFSGG